MIRGRRAGLPRILDDLGATLLELVHGDPEQVPHVREILIHDPLDDAGPARAAIVLGVGVGGEAEVVRLLTGLGRQGAAALVVRAPVPATTAVLSAADSAGVALLGLTRGATWAQLAAMLRALLGEGDVGVGSGESESLGGLPAGDLFALANAIAALLDAPITIEDRANRVLAFSGRQDEADRGRIETVLGLQVPERFARRMVERGDFHRLFRSDRPVTVDPIPAEDGSSLPRAAIAVRAGDEVLGSIWVALHEPLNDERVAALCEAAKLAALHMLRVRAGADVERRLRADLVSTALEGGAGAREALHRLELADRPVLVLGLAVVDAPGGDGSTGDEAEVDNERRRLADAFAVHLSAVHPRSATALVGHCAYGLVPVTHEGAEEDHAVRIASGFLDRVGDRVRAVIGVGPVARDVAGLVYARGCADRALRVLREGRGAQRVAKLSDIYVSALVLELRDLVAARGDEVVGPVAQLRAYDAEHHTVLVDTLGAWLDAFGDVNAAAAALYVHPNTFRYRLRRLAEISGMDLGDPEVRFAALLQLRVVGTPAL